MYSLITVIGYEQSHYKPSISTVRCYEQSHYSTSLLKSSLQSMVTNCLITVHGYVQSHYSLSLLNITIDFYETVRNHRRYLDFSYRRILMKLLVTIDCNETVPIDGLL